VSPKLEAITRLYSFDAWVLATCISYDDIQVLAEYELVHFEQADRAKRLFVPYDSIEVSLEISISNPADDAVLT